MAGQAQKPNATNWTIDQRKFIAWVATPTELREDRRLEDFAKRIKKDRTTLWRWKNIPGFWDEVTAATKQYLGDSVPETIAVLKEMARRGSFNHLKMYLEMAGLYKEETEQKHTGTLKIEIEYVNGQAETSSPS